MLDLGQPDSFRAQSVFAFREIPATTTEAVKDMPQGIFTFLMFLRAYSDVLTNPF